MNSKQAEKLKELAGELAKDIKTGADLSSLSAILVKLTVEAALGAEMENHLGYPRHSSTGHLSGNSRNGTTPKILKGNHGEVLKRSKRSIRRRKCSCASFIRSEIRCAMCHGRITKQ